MVADRQPSALLSADRDLILHDEFADELESDWSFVQLNTMRFRERVDQVRCGDRFRDSVLPAAALHQEVEEYSDHVLWLQERPVLVHDTEAIGIAISCNPDPRSGFPHLLAQVVEQMIVRF